MEIENFRNGYANPTAMEPTSRTRQMAVLTHTDFVKWLMTPNTTAAIQIKKEAVAIFAPVPSYTLPPDTACYAYKIMSKYEYC